MLILDCPTCGPRPSDEFTHHGELVDRPPTSDVDPGTWRRYLYFRRNPAGWQVEHWFHRDGCRRFLQVRRNTVTNQVDWVRQEPSSR